MEIIRGKIQTAQKIVIYGPEGIGKSTFAAQFPDPLFCDTEGSTNNMDVARLSKPTSWEMLKEQVDFVKANRPCKTFVIDTFDWAEQLCIENICATYQKKGIEDFGYGNGYVYEKEEIGRFLNKLQELVDIGINVVLTCHAHIKKFEQPDEFGSYDRWELKLGKKTGSQISPLVKEWADMVLFANYKVYTVASDKEGKKLKAQGGARVMYTSHHPCWDAKNRFGLPEEMPFEYKSIANCISGTHPVVTDSKTAVMDDGSESVAYKQTDQPQEEQSKSPVDIDEFEEIPDIDGEEDLSSLPKELADLMRENNVSRLEIQLAVSDKGYYPIDTPIENYDPAFVRGVLVGAWQQVFLLICENRKDPFQE